MRYLLLLLVCASLTAATTAAQQTPSPGSPERKAILDALRPYVEKDLRQPVRFKVDVFRVQEGWAFIRGVPQRPDGKEIDYRGTRYQEAKDQGAFDDWFCALLQRKGGKWHVVTYAIGATDVVWEPWPEKYKAPATIFA